MKKLRSTARASVTILAAIVVVGLVPRFLPAGRGVPVVQLHGFADDTAPDSDVVVSAEQKADFVHVEVSEDIRETSSARDRIASALAGRKVSR